MYNRIFVLTALLLSIVSQSKAGKLTSMTDVEEIKKHIESRISKYRGEVNYADGLSTSSLGYTDLKKSPL